MDWDGKGIWIGCIREGDWFKQVFPARAKGLQRAGKKLAAGVRKVCGGRQKTWCSLEGLLLQWEVMIASTYLHLPQGGFLTIAEMV